MSNLKLPIDPRIQQHRKLIANISYVNFRNNTSNICKRIIRPVLITDSDAQYIKN